MEHFPIYQKTNPESARATIDRSIDGRAFASPHARASTSRASRAMTDEGKPPARSSASRLGSIRGASGGKSRNTARGTRAAAADGSSDARATPVRARRTSGQGASRGSTADDGTATGERDGGGDGDGGAAPRRATRASTTPGKGKAARRGAGSSGGDVAMGDAVDERKTPRTPTRGRGARGAVKVKEERPDERGGDAGETPGTPVGATLGDGVHTTPARQARMSKSKQAQLALEEASRRIQHDRVTEEEMYDAEEDWADKSQYYPTVLTERSRDVEGSSVGDVVRSTDEGNRFVVLQLPSDLPLIKRPEGEEMDVDGVVEVKDDDELGDEQNELVRGVADLANGQLGELKIHADGSAKLYIGNAAFDVMHGIPYQHSEHLARLDESKRQCVIMGSTVARLTCVPDVTQLLL